MLKIACFHLVGNNYLNKSRILALLIFSLDQYFINQLLLYKNQLFPTFKHGFVLKIIWNIHDIFRSKSNIEV